MTTHTITHLFCLHTITHTQASPPPSQLKRSKSLLTRLLSPQKQTPPQPSPHSKSFIQTLCSSCIHVWSSHGISPEEARARTLEYRVLFGYHGPLTPVTGGERGMVLLSQDFVPTATSLMSGGDEEGNVEGVRFLREIEGWWESENRALPQEEGEGKRGSMTALLELSQEQADIGTQRIPTPELRRSTDRFFVVDDLDTQAFDSESTGRRSNDGFVHPDGFEIERWDLPLPGPVNGEGFERQALQFPRRKLGPERKQPSVGMTRRESIDLDKPLPPPPRHDTPRPGAAFNGQVPDRDLPRGKYYPRFI